VESVSEDVEGMRVYHELDPTFYSATSGTFIGSIYAMFGLDNIADEAPDLSGGYPQLSAEYVVGQAPDLIVLADTVCCGESAETVAQRPAFAAVPAVQEGRILAADDDIASRWGPRIADFAESVAETLKG
jgi:iron complex transport system substrate-binding protein